MFGNNTNHILVCKMVKLKIKCNKEQFEALNSELKTKFGNIIRAKFKEDSATLKFTNKSTFDKTEFDIYDYIKGKYEILTIEKISRSFVDIHEIENTKEFKENIKDMQEIIKPFYMYKKEYWWIGLENANPNDLDIQKTIREIYKIGLCCGLVPRGMV